MSLRPDPLRRLPPYFRCDDVFTAIDHADLLDWAMSNEQVLAPSRVGRAGVVNLSARNSRSMPAGTEPPWKAPLVDRVRAMLPEMMDSLGITPFAIDRIDSELVAYNDGGFLRRHIDIATRATRHPSDRVLSAVYYFHNEPKNFDGGELRLLPLVPGPDGERPHIDIEPRQNMLVAFPAWALHEVLKVRCPSRRYTDSRFSINFWVRRARA